MWKLFSSAKEQNNRETLWREPSQFSKFMHLSNQRYLAKTVYNIAKENGCSTTYTFLQKQLPKVMKSWYLIKKADSKIPMDFNDHTEFINEMFVRDNPQLYCNTASNVFKSKIHSTHINPMTDEIEVKEFNSNDLTYEAYKNMDVWRPVHINIDERNSRDKSAIPIWQTSMHTRHFDRTESFKDSWENQVSGYGDIMDDLARKKQMLIEDFY